MKMETPTTEEKLKRLSYAELKKHAKVHGIKANMKAEKIIAALISENINEDSFLALEQQIINSSKKNKEEKFNRDKVDSVSETPRRDTYTVENSEIRLAEINEAIVKSASPELDSSNVTMSRGSERILRNRKVSFVTPIKSPRVSFSSSKYISLKDRPKTPIPARSSEGRRVSFVTPNKTKPGPKQSLPTTPHPMASRQKARMSKDVISEKLNETPQNVILEVVDQASVEENTCIKQDDPLKGVSSEVAIEITGPEDSQKDTAEEKDVSIVENLIPSSGSVKRKRPSSPKQSGKKGNGRLQLSNRKKILTPNFKAIHAKNFQKMESIVDYQKRKAERSAKKFGKNVSLHSRMVSTPTIKKTLPKPPNHHAGLSFIPTITVTSKMNLDFSSVASKNKNSSKENSKPVFEAKGTKVENAIKSSVSKPGPKEKKNMKFDLKASLMKKLPYKPHSGPLKPVEINLNNTMNSSMCFHKNAETQNNTVQQTRFKSRAFLRGVRTNRRFELQMSKRS
ncbi:nucleolar and spindle-associated protein 1-like [Uloborus diversus]|uniref:nucleolar and spindle-associated protein 1-like n=1 Tax=Uloborus diversus TaxID=327109 RepID=UPI00240A73C5|nr:nucleolar and spindle-associated protein 1-like [Uloborus diversus]